NVVNAEPARPVCRVKVLASRLNTQHFTRRERQYTTRAVSIGFLEQAAAALELLVFVWVGQPVQIAAFHGLGLFPLGWHNSLKAFLALCHKNIPPEEIVEVRSLH